MTKDRNQFRDDLTDGDGAGWINRFLAEEDEFDGQSMWRLVSWGVGSVGVLIIAILATRSPAAINRDQLASAEVARQTQQVQWIARESQNKAKELAAAVETLNGDRDRLYARVTVLEQGLDSVTGALARPAAATLPAITQAAPATTAPALAIPAASAETDLIGPVKPAEAKAEPIAPQPPKIAPVATATPAASPAPARPAEQKVEAPPADPVPTVTAAIAPIEPIASEATSANIVRKTEFGVDLGGAKSIEGLRAVWRGALKVYSQQLASLQPIIVVKERHDGFGMQLRLVAGPLSDAAEAAKLCAGFLTESNRPCETSVYEGQRLSMVSEKQPEAKKPDAPVHRAKRRSKQRSEPVQEQPKTSSFSSFFGNR